MTMKAMAGKGKVQEALLRKAWLQKETLLANRGDEIEIGSVWGDLPPPKMKPCGGGLLRSHCKHAELSLCLLDDPLQTFSRLSFSAVSRLTSSLKELRSLCGESRDRVVILHTNLYYHVISLGYR